MSTPTTGSDLGRPSEFGAAWSTANDAAQRLARGASGMVRNLHQGRIPTRIETEHVKDMTAKLMEAMEALNRLERGRQA
ncbi:MAG TPA: hypothetical protein VIP77_04845 [Jiangellaceae bacterium]